ncbi:MAG: helix-turn-helix transcriptional regulator [Lachnospiraceae bacterium]|nr:helix-turn-helix transcriptional regulator [Lachnospiraceae bacterium]
MNQKIPREEYNRIKIAIGENIRNLRLSRNWTQEELIERLELIGLSDISANTISRTENGHSMPNLITVIYLAKVYAVSIDSLISM